MHLQNIACAVFAIKGMGKGLPPPPPLLLVVVVVGGRLCASPLTSNSPLIWKWEGKGRMASR